MTIFYLTARRTMGEINFKQTTKQLQQGDLLFWGGWYHVVLKVLKVSNARYPGHPYEIRVLEPPNMTTADLMIYQSELKEKDEQQ